MQLNQLRILSVDCSAEDLELLSDTTRASLTALELHDADDHSFHNIATCCLSWFTWYCAVVYHYAHTLLPLHHDLDILGETPCGRLIEAVFGNGSQLEFLSLAGHETTFDELEETNTNLAVLPQIHTLKLTSVHRDIQLRTLLLACPSIAHLEIDNGKYGLGRSCPCWR